MSIASSPRAAAPADQQVHGVGLIEEGLAQLARAELAQARGDRAAATAALARACACSFAERDLRIAEGACSRSRWLIGDDARAAEVAGGPLIRCAWPHHASPAANALAQGDCRADHAVSRRGPPPSARTRSALRHGWARLAIPATSMAPPRISIARSRATPPMPTR